MYEERCPICGALAKVDAPQAKLDATCTACGWHFESQTRKNRHESGRCVCGHKMHSLKPPHACWQHEAGTCPCTEFQGVNGEPFDDAYFRGGKRYDRPCPVSTESNP